MPGIQEFTGIEVGSSIGRLSGFRRRACCKTHKPWRTGSLRILQSRSDHWALAVSLSEAANLMFQAAPLYVNAAISYEQTAIKELQLLNKNFPKDIDFWGDFAEADARLWKHLSDQKKVDQAAVVLDRLKATYQTLAHFALEGKSQGKVLAGMLENAGDVLEQGQNLDAASEWLGAARERWSALGEEPTFQGQISQIDRKLALLREKQHRDDDAVEFLNEAEAIDRRRVAATPADRDAATGLWADLYYIGLIQAELKHDGKALENFSEMRTLIKVYRAGNPNDSSTIDLLIDVDCKIGRIEREHGKLAESFEAYNDVLRVAASAMRNDLFGASVPDNVDEAASAIGSLAYAFDTSGDFANGLAAAEAALTFKPENKEFQAN